MWFAQRDDPEELSCLAYLAMSVFEHEGGVFEVVPPAVGDDRPCKQFEADHVAMADERLRPVNLTKAEKKTPLWKLLRATTASS